MGDIRESVLLKRDVEVKDYRRALSRFATGVVVMTALTESEKPRGVTVNSFTSVSLDPPLILWCLSRSSTMFDDFDRSDCFAVNVLPADQAELSRKFATRLVDRFLGVPWIPGDTGAPLLKCALATFECSVHEKYPAGDHMIFVGRVHTYREAEGEPLIFHSGAYWQASRV